MFVNLQIATKCASLKRLQAESGQCPQPTLNALLASVLDKAFQGEL